MATVPHPFSPERAAVPRIVLPITSRGIAVTDRVCWGVLALAMAVAAGLILYLNRGTTFFFDEVAWLYDTPSLGPSDVLDPHNGHLVATTRIAYKAILETVGADYLAFRLLGLFALLLCTAIFYALVKRRIGALPALAPTVVLLFLGSASQHVLIPIGFTPLLSIAAGLAALLALERGDRRGEVAACALLTLSVLTYSTGLAFLAGIAVSVLLRGDRRGRAWIFLIPFALYAAWWLGHENPVGSSQDPRASNALLFPNYVAESLAVVSASLTGLGYNFTDQSLIDPGWGRVVALLAGIGLAVRMRRGSIPPSLLVSLAIVLTFWAMGTLVQDAQSFPAAVRYIFMGSVGVLLVATDAARSIRFSKLGLIALLGATLFSLAANGALLRDRAASFRSGSALIRAEFAMLDLARGHVDPRFRLASALPRHSFLGDRTAAEYFAVAERYGSPGFSLAELERQPEAVRERADQVLGKLLGVRVAPSSFGRPSRGCERIRSTQPGAPVRFEVPAGGASLSAGGAPAAVTLARFAEAPTVEAGTVAPGEPATLTIPPDASPTPWRASIAGVEAITVCPRS